jgi:glycosyltransferase involved in cell wall biosynthesis
VSSFTARLVESVRGEPPTAQFLAYSDLSSFADPPIAAVPGEHRVVFVGALEPYKNIDGLAAAWRDVVHTDARAKLTIIGRGSRRFVVEQLVRDLTGSVTHHAVLAPERIARELDASRALVLPSYPEGLGRVVLEAFARGRGVVGTDGGGIPDMVTHELNGLLVPPHDTTSLASALRRILDDHELAVRLGEAARATYADWHQTPADFAEAYRALVDDVLSGAR